MHITCGFIVINEVHTENSHHENKTNNKIKRFILFSLLFKKLSSIIYKYTRIQASDGNRHAQ